MQWEYWYFSLFMYAHRCSHDDEDVSVGLMELHIIIELFSQLPKHFRARKGDVTHFLWKQKGNKSKNTNIQKLVWCA